MTRLLIGSAAVLLTLALGWAAQTEGSAAPGAKGPAGCADYHKKYGVKFAYGYYYPGKVHRHWSKSYYSMKWKCTFHYCPYAKAWYYYHAPKKAYYPASYVREAPPTPGGAPGGATPPAGVTPGPGKADPPTPPAPTPAGPGPT